MKIFVLALGLLLLYLAAVNKHAGVWSILTGQPLPTEWSGGGAGGGGGGGGGGSGFG